MPLEAEETPSFFPDEGLPPLGMRLAILDVFLVGSAYDSCSSLGGELSLEDFPDLLLSSLTLDMDLLPFAEAFENEDEGEEEEEVFPGVAREDAEDLVGICLVVALLLPLLHTDPMGINPSSPYSDRSSSSCRAISATDGDAREADLGLIRRNFSSMDLWGPPPPTDPTFDPSLPCWRRPSEPWGECVGEGECVGLASMDEVALCLRFMDLLRQDLPAVGEGMAEASCCPLRLVGTVPPIPLPFIPPGAGIPLTDSEPKKKRNTIGRLLGHNCLLSYCTLRQNFYSPSVWTLGFNGHFFQAPLRKKKKQLFWLVSFHRSKEALATIFHIDSAGDILSPAMLWWMYNCDITNLSISWRLVWRHSFSDHVKHLIKNICYISILDYNVDIFWKHSYGSY